MKRFLDTKKLVGLLALLGVTAGAVVALRDRAEAMPPPLQLVKVECIGTAGTTTSPGCCNETGARDYTYRVVLPGGNAVSINRVDIGTHEPDPAEYTNLLMPSGWSMTIVALDPLWSDKLSCDSHGSFVTPDSPPACPYVLRWSGTAQTSTFTVGFDQTNPNKFDIHDVHWKVSNGNQADWSQAVGDGKGPVHCLYMP